VADALATLSLGQRLGLQEVNLPERVEILLNVPRTDSNIVPLTKLSTGQQCTAILQLLLLDNEDPLILPEDAAGLTSAIVNRSPTRNARGSIFSSS
jgi:hypothetical protein